jgi:acyl-CoA thioesterase-1
VPRPIRAIFLVLAALLLAGAGPRQLLFLGDSLTEGLGVAKDAAYPAVVGAELKAKGYLDLTIVNAGISGSTTASGPGRLKWALKGGSKPFVLVLALGANDGLRGVDLKAVRENLVATVELAQTSGIPHVLLAGMMLPPSYGQPYARDFAKIFPEVAEREKVALIPFLLAGVAGDKTLNQADGIHPNAAGHKLIAQTVRRYLEPLLGEKKPR